MLTWGGYLAFGVGVGVRNDTIAPAATPSNISKPSGGAFLMDRLEESLRDMGLSPFARKVAVGYVQVMNDELARAIWE
jgi:hypothetical protein